MLRLLCNSPPGDVTKSPANHPYLYTSLRLHSTSQAVFVAPSPGMHVVKDNLQQEAKIEKIAGG